LQKKKKKKIYFVPHLLSPVSSTTKTDRQIRQITALSPKQLSEDCKDE
jgi:hypothetical protein